jgi:hypothetical protein
VLRAERGPPSETLGYFILAGAEDYEPFPKVKYF